MRWLSASRRRAGALGLVLSMHAASAATEEVGWPADDPEMIAAREALYYEHGGQPHYLILGDRLEYGSDDEAILLWDLQGWYGGDLHRLFLKTEGEYGFDDDAFEEAEIQALYSRAVSPFFDLQVGLRHDLEPEPSRSHLVLGFQGLAPYWFEVDGAVFLSEEGDLTARLEAEYDLLLTQRLVLQPRLEVELAAGEVVDLGIGSGITSTALGFRLRYELRRELAPYLGFSWTDKHGATADLARAAGESTGGSSFVVGLRFWY